MSGWEQAQKRADILITFAFEHPDRREDILAACRKAVPLIRKGTLFDPTRGLREAWYSVKNALGITEDA